MLEYTMCRKGVQSCRVPDNGDFVAWWAPDRFVGSAPQDEAGQVKCRRKMRDARIVANKAGAPGKNAGQLGQGQTLGHTCSSWWQRRGEPLQALTLGFATHKKEVESARIDQPLQQFGPGMFGPIFPLTSAPWV